MNNNNKMKIIICQSKYVPQIGDLLTYSTSEFIIDNVTGRYVASYDEKHMPKYKIIAIYEGCDYFEFDPGHCNNGGAYGYDFYRVLKVLGGI